MLDLVGDSEDGFLASQLKINPYTLDTEQELDSLRAVKSLKICYLTCNT